MKKNNTKYGGRINERPRTKVQKPENLNFYTDFLTESEFLNCSSMKYCLRYLRDTKSFDLFKSSIFQEIFLLL